MTFAQLLAMTHAQLAALALDQWRLIQRLRQIESAARRGKK